MNFHKTATDHSALHPNLTAESQLGNELIRNETAETNVLKYIQTALSFYIDRHRSDDLYLPE